MAAQSAADKAAAEKAREEEAAAQAAAEQAAAEQAAAERADSEETAPVRYRVIGAVAVIRKDKRERYIDRGGIVPAELIDEENAAHLVRVGLLELVTAE
jgi:hypothetical protein